jgi:hypothetical protein
MAIICSRAMSELALEEGILENIAPPGLVVPCFFNLYLSSSLLFWSRTARSHVSAI